MRRQFLIVASPGYFHSYKSNLILKHTAARPKCPAVFGKGSQGLLHRPADRHFAAAGCEYGLSPERNARHLFRRQSEDALGAYGTDGNHQRTMIFRRRPGNVRHEITQTCAAGSISNVHFTANLIIVTAMPLRPRKGMHHDN